MILESEPVPLALDGPFEVAACSRLVAWCLPGVARSVRRSLLRVSGEASWLFALEFVDPLRLPGFLTCFDLLSDDSFPRHQFSVREPTCPHAAPGNCFASVQVVCKCFLSWWAWCRLLHTLA